MELSKLWTYFNWRPRSRNYHKLKIESENLKPNRKQSRFHDQNKSIHGAIAHGVLTQVGATATLINLRPTRRKNYGKKTWFLVFRKIL